MNQFTRPPKSTEDELVETIYALRQELVSLTEKLSPEEKEIANESMILRLEKVMPLEKISRGRFLLGMVEATQAQIKFIKDGGARIQ